MARTYTVHGHFKDRDGTPSAFWTRTRLTKAQALKLAKEQRTEPGGVAEIVEEKGPPPVYGKPGPTSGFSSTYTVHGHFKDRDGTPSAFWTRTRLTKAQAQKLAKEQRAQPGGVAKIVEEEVLGGKRSHATKKSPAQLQREIDETLASKDKTKTAAGLEKVLADRLGFIPTEDFILRAQGEWAGSTLDALRSEERKMTREFEKRGGRGPDLADRIDEARTALALVDSGFLIKGDRGILKAADRPRPRLKSDFDY
jgi:hypothetical protein